MSDQLVGFLVLGSIFLFLGAVAAFGIKCHVDPAFDERVRRLTDSPGCMMIWGGFMLCGGVAASIASYREAAESWHGGTWTLKIGAVVVGGVFFLWGLVRHLGGRERQ